MMRWCDLIYIWTNFIVGMVIITVVLIPAAIRSAMHVSIQQHMFALLCVSDPWGEDVLLNT